MARGDGPQLAQRDGMVTADREWDYAGLQDRTQSIDHDLIAGLDVARDDGQVAGVHYREVVEDLDLVFDVEWAQQARCLPDSGRPEAAAHPVADPGVEWDAEDSRVDAVHIADLGQAHEAADAGEARCFHSVHRPVFRHGLARSRPPSCSLRG